LRLTFLSPSGELTNNFKYIMGMREAKERGLAEAAKAVNFQVLHLTFATLPPTTSLSPPLSHTHLSLTTSLPPPLSPHFTYTSHTHTHPTLPFQFVDDAELPDEVRTQLEGSTILNLQGHLFDSGLINQVRG
jgi:hypothetical protein